MSEELDTTNTAMIQQLAVNFLEQTDGVEPGELRGALTMLLLEVIKAERAGCLEAVSACAVGPNRQIAAMIGMRIKTRGMEHQ